MKTLQTSALLVLLLSACRDDGTAELRRHMAALKVAAEQSQTQTEFHQRWTECAAYMEAARPRIDFQPLQELAKATDTLWRNVEDRSNHDRVYCGAEKTDTPCWRELLIISPSMTTNADRFVTIRESDANPEFWLSTHAQRGREQVAAQCHKILQHLQ